MTLQEKISVMQSYQKGEAIQWATKEFPGDFKDFKGDEPNWNWGDFIYRVKPNKDELNLTKGQKFVYKRDCNKANPTIYEFDSCKNGLYVFIGYCDIQYKISAKDFKNEMISVDDVLWYWEVKYGDDWEMDTSRATKAKITNGYLSGKAHQPIYALGFKLKD